MSAVPAVCPYCQAALKKQPQRKTRCASCRQFMYFKSTPDNPQKRLMTEPEATEAEKQWSETYAWRSSMRRIRSAAASLGIGDAAFDEIRAITDSDAKALDLLLSKFVVDNPDSPHAGFALFLQVGLARQEGWSPHARLMEYFRHKLREWVGRDFVVGVEVSIPYPRPWPPAMEMMAAHARGETVEEISARTGYAKVTVERALETEGKSPANPGVGEHCQRLAATLYPVSRALAEMPLPCEDDCVCDWRPVFRSDAPRFDPIAEGGTPAVLSRRRRPTAG